MFGLADQQGFTLVELLVALVIMVTVTAGVAQLFVVAANAGRASRDRTIAVALATGKLEQLRSLTWRFDVDATGALTARTDSTSNLAVEPPVAGGPGLKPSPAGTLDRNVPHYVDYLDRHGRWIGTGASVSPQAVYIRRWAVRPVPSDPQQMVVLQVLVTTVQREASRTTSVPHAWNGQDVLLSTLVTRKAR